MIDYEKELVLRGLDIHKSGENWMLRCPFHDEKNPSFGVNVDTGVYNCFNPICGEKGTFHQLVAYLDGISEADSWKRLHEQQTIDHAVRTIERAFEDLVSLDEVRTVLKKADVYRRFAPIVGTAGAAYVEKRGIDEYTMNNFDLMWGGEEGRWANRVIIPILDERGQLVTIAGRTVVDGVTPKTKKLRGRKVDTLFGAQMLRHLHPYLILVEGEFDAMFLNQKGFKVAAVMGSTLKPRQLCQIVQAAQTTIVLFDGDEAGRKGAEKIVKQLRSHMICDTHKLPEGVDPNSMNDYEVEKLVEFITWWTDDG